jgi:hypothetical protein
MHRWPVIKSDDIVSRKKNQQGVALLKTRTGHIAQGYIMKPLCVDLLMQLI